MQVGLDPEKLVFIDESGAKSNMTRLYGRALRGVRLIDRVPHGHWVNTTLVCALRRSGMTASSVLDGAMNKQRLEAYVRDVLCPTLQEGDIVVWDNLPAHKSAVAKELIEAKGAKSLPLPPYSPDLNPIEMSFAKLKSVLRKEKIRDIGTLREFLQNPPKLFSPTECQNYLKHAGYCPY
jgi:transposase